jgi:hypothetical protein
MSLTPSGGADAEWAPWVWQERRRLWRERERGVRTLAFNARPFVLCGLPLRRLPKEQLF